MTSPAPATVDGGAYGDDLLVALRAADAADAVSMARFDAADLVISTKPDRTPVTEADLATEQAIRGVLDRKRPDDAVFGEEYGAYGAARRQWIIDPIDGTANYLRGVPVWGTLIALAVDGVPVVGVVSMPALARRWWAARGAGAFTATATTPRTLAVSRVAELADASVSFQSVRQWDDAGRLDALIDLTRAVWRDRAYGDVWSYMLLAEGRLDAVAEFDVREYDIAAAVPIVEEAGGRFTAFDGSASITARSSLATNGVLHDRILDFLHESHDLADASREISR